MGGSRAVLRGNQVPNAGARHGTESPAARGSEAPSAPCRRVLAVAQYSDQTPARIPGSRRRSYPAAAPPPAAPALSPKRARSPGDGWGVRAAPRCNRATVRPEKRGGRTPWYVWISPQRDPIVSGTAPRSTHAASRNAAAPRAGPVDPQPVIRHRFVYAPGSASCLNASDFPGHAGPAPAASGRLYGGSVRRSAGTAHILTSLSSARRAPRRRPPPPAADHALPASCPCTAARGATKPVLAAGSSL